MKGRRILMIFVVFLGLMVCQVEVSAQIPIGTSFTYQGWLMDKNNPAEGEYDFEFRVFDDPNAGAQQGSTIDVNDLYVADGHFTVELDFGSGIFTGEARWLETTVREGASNDPCDFVTLSPRQELTPTSYAIYAETAGVVPGGITGSGTVNRVPAFTSTNTIGDSVICLLNGNVGIGLMNPSQRLDVGGVLRVVADNPSILLYDVNAPWDDRYFMIRGSNQDLNFISLLGNMEYEQRIMVMKSTGNVGIGATEPGAKLEVAGQIKITGGTPGANKVLTSDASGLASWQNLQSLPGGVPSGVIVMWSGSIATTPAGWALCDGTNGTPDLRDRFIVGARQDDGGKAKSNIEGSLKQSGGDTSHDHGGATGSEGGKHLFGGGTLTGRTPSHTHSISSDEHIPPYYALAFIMKL